jgi:hypothetical protein
MRVYIFRKACYQLAREFFAFFWGFLSSDELIGDPESVEEGCGGRSSG